MMSAFMNTDDTASSVATSEEVSDANDAMSEEKEEDDYDASCWRDPRLTPHSSMLTRLTLDELRTIEKGRGVILNSAYCTV